MSFYGNILYELTNAFAEIMVKNSGRNSSTTISPSSGSSEIPAVGLGGRFTLDSGNKWIHLSSDPNNQVCKIYHSGIDSTNTAHSFTTIDNPDNAINAIELIPGDYLSGEQVYYDEAGHVTGSKQVVYKLPISETEAELIELQEKMATLEANDAVQDTAIGTNTGDLTTLKSTMEDVQGNLSDVKALVGNKIYMTIGDTSITQAIGSIENIQGLATGHTNNISNALHYLKNEINNRDNTISDVSTANRYAMSKLIEQLEAQLGIEIDESVLWPTS